MPLLHSNPNLVPIRNCAAELLASVLVQFFPTAQMAGGGATDKGFYYDFVFHQPIDKNLLDLVEVEMKKLVKEEGKVKTLSMMKTNASDLLIHHKQPLLADLALEQDSNVISLLQINDFFGLCEEPHIASLDEIGFLKLIEIESIEKFLPTSEIIEVKRIYGTCFLDPYSLKQFLKSYDKWKKNDHLSLGKELNLFFFSEKMGHVDCIWTPKGKWLMDRLISIWRNKQSFLEIESPLVVKSSFLKPSFLELPAFSRENEEFSLSYEYLPHHIEYFNSLNVKKLDDPIRVGEVGSVYQNFSSLHLEGLFKGLTFKEDRMTIFCKEDQVLEELNYSLLFIDQIVRIFDVEAYWCLVSLDSKGPRARQNRKAISWLTDALKQRGVTYEERVGIENEEPRIEVVFADSLGREWTGPCVSVVTSAHDKLEIGPQESVVILNRTLFSSINRFVGLLVEKSKGELPLWLAPEQIRVISMGEQSRSFAELVYQACRERNWRVNLDCRDEKLGSKIHAAEKEKIPYLIIVGDKEANKKQVTIRSLKDKDRSFLLDLEELFRKLEEEYKGSNEPQ